MYVIEKLYRGVDGSDDRNWSRSSLKFDTRLEANAHIAANRDLEPWVERYKVEKAKGGTNE